jgi:hypothetical protein
MAGVLKKSIGWLLLLSLASCDKSERDVGGPVIEPGDAHLELGTAGAVEADRWNVFRMRVRNRGLDFRGTLEVRGIVLGDDYDPVTYSTSIELPGKSSAFREYAFPVRPEGWSKLVSSFSQPGYTRSFRLALAPSLAPAFRVLVLGVTAGEIANLKSYFAAELKKSETEQRAALEPRFSFLEPAHYPTLARAYDPFQLVLFEGTSLAEASEEAIDALAAWVSAGGTLAVIPGQDWAPGPPDRLRRVLARAAFLPSLPPGTPGRFPGPDDAPALYRALDACLGRAVSFAGDSASRLREVEREIAMSLHGLAGLNVPTRRDVVLGLLVYALAGFFVPAAIFKRLRRREWSFAVMLVAAGAAGFAVFGLGVLTSVKAREIEEISVVRMAADETVGHATSFLGIISPRFEQLEIQEPDGSSGLDGALPQPLRAERFSFYRSADPLPIPPTEIRVEKGRDLRLAPFRLLPNAMHFLRYDYDAPLGGALTVERLGNRSSGVGEIRIVNCGDAELDLYLVADGKSAHWSSLASGQAASKLDWDDVLVRGSRATWNRYMAYDDESSPSADGSQERLVERAALGAVLAGIASPFPRDERSGPSQQDHGATAQAPWSGYQPRFVVAVARSPVFPVVQGVAARKARSFFVIEIPREVAR